MKARGERNGRARITAENALEIYDFARSGRYAQRAIADGYDISQSLVSLIKHRARWRWLLEDGKEQGMSENDDLRAEIEKLKTRQAELEAQLAGEPRKPFKAEPQRPLDYTRGASMDAETMRDLAKAIPDDLARDLHADLARGNPITASPAQLTPDRGGQVQIQRGDGWAPERKIEPPPGVPIMDRLMDMQDAIDKADLQRRLARSKE